MRFTEHCSDTCSSKCPKLYNAIKKYGKENFKIECLVECNDSFLDEYETKFIDIYNTLHPNGYNLKLGGEGGKH